MKGIEIARAYYERHGKPVIAEKFADDYNKMAFGLVGEGSECFGFDDDISKDHDFEAGFCIWLTREDWQRFGFELERVYAKLPREFMGLRRSIINPVGGKRRGVFVIGDFYDKFLGSESTPKELMHWLSIPPCALACAVNGEVFADGSGEFSKIRAELAQGYPEDVRLKKLAAHIALMGQAGQYNYERCLKRGEYGAAGLALNEFVKHAISAAYLINNAYEPFYKWAFRGMRGLGLLSGLEMPLTGLIGSDRRFDNAEITDDVISHIICELRRQGLSREHSTDLERHACSIQNSIKDVHLRNMHIMDGI